ncbi:hypothetical protein BPOR_0411g00050 [Botrytis porri]|uniref:Nephrocystin 3-like N-terminal domain-containing protein n=1 Tax=Botrytis porri TaxID=87229 RepID=A0A4Z1KIY8_9HELO|nr:hypothetical protein BPOR_0411g00050 [Botrytis porri]
MQRCIQDLRLSDPRDNKKRIEGTKGGLLQDSYNSPSTTPSSDNGAATSKASCLGSRAILLERSKAKSVLLSYFFCQATDSRINYATAVLQGLIHLLVDQQPSLISHIRTKYDQAGKTLFEDTNTWVVLSEIIANMLQDPSLDYVYLIVDTLDECVADLPKLFDVIVQTSSISPRIKWIVSSRNWPNIERTLDTVTQKLRLCLELNEKSVSAAVATFIQFKVEWLAKRNKYHNDTREAIQQYLTLNANGTFLWVALICQELSNVSRWKALQKVTLLPPGLNALYQRMLDQIMHSEDAELCRSILAVVSTVYRPVTLDELMAFVDMLDRVFSDYEALSEIIGLCGSFLTLRERTIFFVHHPGRVSITGKNARKKTRFVTSNSSSQETSNNESNGGRKSVEDSTVLVECTKISTAIVRKILLGLKAPKNEVDEVNTQPIVDFGVKNSLSKCIEDQLWLQSSKCVHQAKKTAWNYRFLASCFRIVRLGQTGCSEPTVENIDKTLWTIQRWTVAADAINMIDDGLAKTWGEKADLVYEAFANCLKKNDKWFVALIVETLSGKQIPANNLQYQFNPAFCISTPLIKWDSYAEVCNALKLKSYAHRGLHVKENLFRLPWVYSNQLAEKDDHDSTTDKQDAIGKRAARSLEPQAEANGPLTKRRRDDSFPNHDSTPSQSTNGPAFKDPSLSVPLTAVTHEQRKISVNHTLEDVDFNGTSQMSGTLQVETMSTNIAVMADINKLESTFGACLFYEGIKTSWKRHQEGGTRLTDTVRLHLPDGDEDFKLEIWVCLSIGKTIAEAILRPVEESKTLLQRR